MNKKTLSLIGFVALTLIPAPLYSDVWHSESSAEFSGVITAVETVRNSFTVESKDGIVKMFAVSAARKSTLTVGSSITVAYREDYQWPLRMTSINGGNSTK